MKSFQEKEKKLYKLLNKLNNFDVSQIQNKDQLEIETLKDQKNQMPFSLVLVKIKKSLYLIP